MKPQNELALIVGYYLSRMDKGGWSALGYKTFTEATQKIGEILGVKKNTIKNMRDEFDPYHQNERIGWKRELRGSRLKILKAFQEIDDASLFEIVKEILQNNEFKDTEEYQDIHSLFGEKEQPVKVKESPIFILRGPTGKAAESFYLEYFKKNSLPLAGNIVDSRDFGCGYDFEIQHSGGSAYVEVKGLASETGGVLFTNKEWQTALKYKSDYYLVIIKDISNNPKIQIIQDPAAKLSAKKNIQTTIQVSWNIKGKDIESLTM